LPFIPQEGVRYDMPVPYGPSVSPGVESGYDRYTATFSYLTDSSMVADLLPKWFALASEPVLTFTYARMVGMTWMGGRNYNITSVGIPAQYVGNDEVIMGTYTLAIWESDCAPIIAGREWMGSPKKFATIPDTDVTMPAFEFTCSEYDALLIRGSASETEAVSDSELRGLVESGRNVIGLNWKYIPGLDGTADVDYPTAMYQTHPYVEAWRGRGEIDFGEPSLKEAPYSSRIVAVLARLPRLENRGVLVAHSAGAELYRDRTRRLDRKSEKTGPRADVLAAGNAAM
jgi:acetoacetate decarboxylase